jgi:hypothetical protein
MLAHSPPLPLIITFQHEDCEMTAKDEEGVLCALQHRDRVRRIGLRVPSSNLRKIIMAMDGEFPNLERLFIHCREEDDRNLALPKTFQASHLRRLILLSTALPTASPLLTSTVNLVTLVLHDIPLSAYFHPGYLLIRLSHMPQLETLVVRFRSPVPNSQVSREFFRTPTTIRVTLPNLRHLVFKGVNVYLEGLLPQLTTPRLRTLEVTFFNNLTYAVARLLQFMRTLESLRFLALRLNFTRNGITLTAKHRADGIFSPFRMLIDCRHLDWQVASAVQVFNGLAPLLSIVEKLTLGYDEHDLSTELHNEVDPTLWRELLRPFNNVKKLHVQNEFFGSFSQSLLSDEDGGVTPDLLPNLNELGCIGGDEASEPFTPFVNERRERGRPVRLKMVSKTRTARQPRP